MAVASGVTVGQGSSCAAFRANAAGLHLERVPRRPRRAARCGGAVVALIATTPVKITRLRICYAGPVRALCGAAATARRGGTCSFSMKRTQSHGRIPKMPNDSLKCS